MTIIEPFIVYGNSNKAKKYTVQAVQKSSTWMTSLHLSMPIFVYIRFAQNA
jgi:hypothetical protein